MTAAASKTGLGEPGPCAAPSAGGGDALALLTVAYAVTFMDRQILAIAQGDINRARRFRDMQLGRLIDLPFLADRAAWRTLIALTDR
ncbi:hypothetical protein [Sphingomonas sp.]|uniref:hypothetical protein n=1 Tax=Sphingomonas sp. TaxID=28214 RepID=UPI003D6D7068